MMQLFDRRAASRALDVSLATLDRLIAAGEVEVVRVGSRAIRVDPAALAQFVARRTERRRRDENVAAS